MATANKRATDSFRHEPLILIVAFLVIPAWEIEVKSWKKYWEKVIITILQGKSNDL